MHFTCLLLSGFVIFTPFLHAQPLVRISEFMASNATTIVDPDFNETGDWIELYNADTNSVSLGGFFLTDDLSEPKKWQLPEETTLAPNGFLLIWADDASEGYHTNFKLSAEGEQIGLFDPQTTLIDSISYQGQTTDVSYGRLAERAKEWRFFNTPTPGLPNDTTGYLGFSPSVTFSIPGGFHKGAQTLELSSSIDRGAIRYTTDGSRPTLLSIPYSDSISVMTTSVIRAAVFLEDHVPGAVTTHTYLIDELTQLPVFSIATNPDNLWDDSTGIYVAGTNGSIGNCTSEPRNWNRDWERPANVEFFEADQNAILNQRVDISIFGGCSRLLAQKSLSVRARNRYGEDKLNYRFFPNKDISAFESIVLRNSGQDWYKTMFHDGMIQTLIQEGMGLDNQAYRPAILFLNGVYWGIHNIREKTNTAFIEANHGYEKDEIDFLEHDRLVIEGNTGHYDQLIEFISSTDMTQNTSMATVAAMIDLDGYIDYLVAQVYIGNADWPQNNVKYWRPNTEGGQWRWIIFDTDFSFGASAGSQPDANTLFRVTDDSSTVAQNSPWSTLLVRKVLENRQIRERFAQRMASHINTTFDSTHVWQVIDSLQANIASEVPRHNNLWPPSTYLGGTRWNAHIENLRNFASERPAQVRRQIAELFGYDQTARLRITTNEPNLGHVYVSDVQMKEEQLDGIYFAKIPLELRAIPLSGARFVRWDGSFLSTEDSTTVRLLGAATIRAVFEKQESITSLDEAGSEFRFALAQNYPNPLSHSTTIPYELHEPTRVTIDVYNALGRRIMRVLDAFKGAGIHKQTFEAGHLAAGTYIYELRAGAHIDRNMFTVVK